MWYAIEGFDGSNGLAGRATARTAHLARLVQLRDAGRLLLAGPCPAIDAEDPGPAGFSGSLVVAGGRVVPSLVRAGRGGRARVGRTRVDHASRSCVAGPLRAVVTA